VENTAGGFVLTLPDQQKLASGSKVTLADTRGDKITIELVVNFPDFVPGVNPSIAHSNPFGIVGVADRLYVTDGGENKIWQIDLPTGSFNTLTEFPSVNNPLFPALGGPVEDAVPTGIIYSKGQLLVTLFRGVPFAPGTSSVEQVDPATGRHAAVIDGLTSAIGTARIGDQGDTGYLVLQFSSIGPFLGGPGLVLRFDSPHSPAHVVADCLTAPTSMVFDPGERTLYVTDLIGHITSIRVEL
jgi:sugar lactone lactonase YvrE